MRGLVVLPGVKLGENGSLSIGDTQDMNELRAQLLYWDRLAMPTQQAIGIGLPGEYEFLRKEGLFQEYRVNNPGGEGTAIFRETRAQLFASLEEKEPGSWAIFSTPGSWDGQQTQEARALRVHLMSALPIPTEDVPLEDILKFRVKRADERAALMSHVDDVYQSVLRAPDRPLAEHSAFKRLAMGASDQINAFHDARLRFRLMDIAADFNVVAGIAAAIGTLSLGAAWPLALGNSIVAGGSVTIGKIVGLRNPKTTNTPFRYVASYHKEVLGD